MPDATAEAIEAAFASLYPRSVRQAGVGGLVTAALSPGSLERPPLDDDDLPLRAPEALRQRGWPLEQLADDELPVLPWLGYISVAEGERWLTIDGFADAPSLLLQPAAGLVFFGASWSASAHLEPDRWLVLSIALTTPSHDEERSRSASLLLGIRRISHAPDDTLAVVVLPADPSARPLWPALLGVEDADLAAALADTITGHLSSLFPLH